VASKFPRRRLKMKKFDHNRAFNSFADLEGVLGAIKQKSYPSQTTSKGISLLRSDKPLKSLRIIQIL